MSRPARTARTRTRDVGSFMSDGGLGRRALVPKISDARFESHYSILKTIELWAGLPLLGHAADASTNQIDPRLIPTTGQG